MHDAESSSPTATATVKPRLLLFYSPTSGRDRRTDGFLAQVLQRNGNHTTFDVQRVDVVARPDLAERFRIRDTPTILVVERNQVVARSSQPRGTTELVELMKPWLQTPGTRRASAG